MNLEKQLIKALDKKDVLLLDKVFEKIYYEYGTLVGCLISKYISNKSDIEDLINDVFMNFYNTIFKSEIKNIKYYLLTQAKNTSINYLKKKKIMIAEYEENIDSPRSIHTNSLFFDLVDKMKKKLSKNEIYIVLSYSIYGYSFKEISYKIHKSPIAIKSIYRRAIYKLKGDE